MILPRRFPRHLIRCTSWYGHDFMETKLGKVFCSICGHVVDEGGAR